MIFLIEIPRINDKPKAGYVDGPRICWTTGTASRWEAIYRTWLRPFHSNPEAKNYIQADAYNLLLCDSTSITYEYCRAINEHKAPTNPVFDFTDLVENFPS